MRVPWQKGPGLRLSQNHERLLSPGMGLSLQKSLLLSRDPRRPTAARRVSPRGAVALFSVLLQGVLASWAPSLPASIHPAALALVRAQDSPTGLEVQESR